MSKLRLFPIFGLVTCVFVVILFTHFKVGIQGYVSKFQQEKVDKAAPKTIYRDYLRYVKRIDSRCRKKQRFGGADDSGYDVCIDSVYRPHKPCLLYSFGSKFVFGFENDIIKNFGCETHTFDPSQPIGDHHIPEGINFHLIGLSDADYKNYLGWPMSSLSSLRRKLNHTSKYIDLLKLDIEGYEWQAIPQILSTVPVQYIKKILIEKILGRKRGDGDDGY
ncbi:uncharacterized protein LOC132719392 [Ruditapes philippinarum]|uniref:uncharacterized protein LOC132719392 n=1 Tax=Ruditapes philippinarum TaxID=129788 RepID=UPI00295B1ED2|nr:uncharacterized protein LOC132719392 [Ruditapes philippinarum]